MVSTLTTSRREFLRQRDQVERLLGNLAELLEDIADAEADASWGLPAMPADAVSDRVADLCARLRTLFFLEETDDALAELMAMEPTLREELEDLFGEHPQLLELLEQIQELAGSSVRPTSTWDDVESHFHRFQRALCRHQRRHDDLRERALVAVVDE
jgi:chromosome segregation ATPase